MTKSDFDCYIVIKNGQYLVAVPYEGCIALRWSTSAYDGYRIADRNAAKDLANMVGGRVVEFNPLSGSVVN